MAVNADGSVSEWISETPYVPGLTNVMDIALGYASYVALKNDGEVVAAGFINDGEYNFLPRGLTNNVVAVVAGDSVGLALVGDTSPFIVQQPLDRLGHRGGSTYFRIKATGLWPLNYQWFFQGQAISGATNAVLALRDLRTDQAGEYWVTVTNALGSTASRVATLGLAPFRLQLALVGDQFRLRFGSASNGLYQVEHKTRLTDPAWNVLTNLPGTGGPLLLELPLDAAESQFYRVQEK